MIQQAPTNKVPTKMCLKKKGCSGFTLVEVLVAFAIIGFALPTFLSSVQTILDNTAYIDQKNYAYWVAENQLAELILKKTIQGEVPKDGQHDKTEFAGVDWFWKVNVETNVLPGKNGPIGKLHILELSVGLEEGESMVTIVGFLDE